MLAVILLLSGLSYACTHGGGSGEGAIPKEIELTRTERAELAPSGGNGPVASLTRGPVSEYPIRATSYGRAYSGARRSYLRVRELELPADNKSPSVQLVQQCARRRECICRLPHSLPTARALTKRIFLVDKEL